MSTGPIQRILVYIDGSEESLVACEYGILLAGSIHASLTAVYVVNTGALNDLRKTHILLAAEEEEYTRDIQEDARRYLDHAQRTAASKGVEIDTLKTSGSIHQEVLKVIEEKEIDLLLLGELPRVRSRLEEYYHEAERLMRSASCSVLIVKDEDRVEELFALED